MRKRVGKVVEKEMNNNWKVEGKIDEGGERTGREVIEGFSIWPKLP